jgi:hypothetical protein
MQEGRWTRCSAPADSPEVTLFLRLSDEPARRLVEAFTAIRRADAEGAMAYGMRAARKA